MRTGKMTTSDTLTKLENLVNGNPTLLFNLRNDNRTVDGTEMLTTIRNAILRGVPLAYFLDRIDVVVDEITSLRAFLTTCLVEKASAFYVSL